MSDSSTPPGTPPPASWLTLELHALGELSEARAEAVARDLDARADSRACLERIQSDRRDLPRLPAPTRPVVGLWARLRQNARFAWVPVAAAAALLFLLGRTQPDQPGIDQPEFAALPGPRIHVKGGDVAISLVRERDGQMSHEPVDFMASDRFKVLVTCPPDRRLRGEVVVLQDHDAAYPLPATDMACGNRIPLPGAFRITGASPAAVCFMFTQAAAQGTVDRATLAARNLDLSQPAVCATLSPLLP